jgi:corrinoid protein of di/trimethylamine methyltransferase
MDNIERLRQAILDYEDELAIQYAREALDEGGNPLDVLDAVTSALTEIGDGYTNGDLFLPDLIAAANTATPILPIVEEAMQSKGQTVKSEGTVVIGTVKGDVHDIGKSMVSALLTAHGFRVVDLGTDVPTQKFIDSIQAHNANVLALSSLLTTTANEQKKVIEAVQAAGIRDQVKVVVGGGAINAQFAQTIGADGYAETASEGVKLVKSLLAD